MGVIPGHSDGDSIASSLNDRNQIEDHHHHQMGITLFPDGHCSDIINQYGQLIGEYSKLDDELWFSKPDEIDDDHDPMPRIDHGLEYQPISYEYPVQQEQLSKSIQNPVAGADIPCVEETSSSLKDSSLDQSQTSSPVSVHRRRRSSSRLRTKATKRARGENGCFVKSNLCESFQLMSHRVPPMESSPFDETPDPSLGKRPRIKKVSDLLQSSGSDKQASQTSSPVSSPEQSSSWEWEPDPTPKRRTKRKHLKMPVKKCMHCESTKTPQWREGPMGHGTLCNACGVKYKHGRLSQEYRPLKSPTFNPNLHSNLRPEAKKMSRKRDAKKCMHCTSTPSPWWEVPIREATVSTNYCPPNPSTIDPCFDSIPEPQQQQQQQSPRISTQDSIQELQQSPRRSMQDSIPELQQQPPRISREDSSTKPKSKKKQETTVKKCMHCESTETPQWREGPMGRKTLCNACGVQFRHGRLFPEYRPLNSPTYDPSLHTHVPIKVQRMRMNIR